MLVAKYLPVGRGVGVGGWARSPAFNSFLPDSDFSHLVMTFANSLDPDQDRHNVGPDLDPNHLTL